MVVDPGGATTDVYSIAEGVADSRKVLLSGVGRTLSEKDSGRRFGGLRHSLSGLLGNLTMEFLTGQLREMDIGKEDFQALIDKLAGETEILTTGKEKEIESVSGLSCRKGLL